MKNKIYLILPALLLSPAFSYAGLFPDGKKMEFIGIISFVTLALGGLFIYSLVWKNNQAKNKKGKERYIIRSVQVTSNGRTYVKSKKIRLVDEPKRKKMRRRART